MGTKKQKVFSCILAVLMLITTIVGGIPIVPNDSEPMADKAYAVNSSVSAGVEEYGLAENMKDGAILHAWCWSFNTIKANMKDIAEAGYTSVQTSPIMKCVVGAGGSLTFTDHWWYHYQPINYTIGNYQLGTEAEFKAMCEEAHKYGVRVIVDVVVNHMTSAWNLIESPWNDSSRFHTNEEVGDWNDRWQVTQKSLLGLWDLNTQSSTVQQGILSYLRQCVADGADGFRYDAAKHIELPGEYGSNFWNVVLNNGSEFQYGETLQDSISRESSYANYMSVTASSYGKKLRDNIGSNNLSTSVVNSWDIGVSKDKMVTWVESHDNYANAITDWGSSQWMSEWQIKMLWAVIGARDGGTPLFFSRPVGGGGTSGDNRFPERTKIGDKGSDLFKDPEVAWVNHFRNAMVGESEYLRNYKGSGCLMIERGNKGVVIINTGSATTLNSDTRLANGTYTDQVSGGTFTVSNGKITGQLLSGKVHVIYNVEREKVSASPSDGTSFKANTLNVTLRASNVVNARYTTSEGASGSYTDGQVITVGSSTAVGGTVTVTLTASKSDGTPLTATYTYRKKDPNEKTVAYFYKPSSWSNAYCYLYNDDPAAAVIKQNGPWPGLPMTSVGNNIYSYEVPNDYTNPRVIFTDGLTDTSTKIPANTTAGVDEPGFQIDGSWIYDSTGTWREYTDVTQNGIVNVVYKNTAGAVLGTETIRGTEGSAYTTSAKSFAGYRLKTAPSNATGIFTSSAITVTYIYEEVETGTVNVVYKDLNGNEISSETLIGELGTAYQTEAKTIRGYELVTAPSNASGIYTRATITVIYVYQQVESDTVTVYLNKPLGWGDSTMYAYIYSGSNKNAEWPGVAMTSMGGGIYGYEVPEGLESGHVLFNNGGSNQTPATIGYAIIDGAIYGTAGVEGFYGLEDTSVQKTFYFEKPSSWATGIKAYIYDLANTSKVYKTWPGDAMTSSGNGVYTYTFDATGYTKPVVIFNDGSNQYPAMNEDGLSIVNGGYYTSSGLISVKKPVSVGSFNAGLSSPQNVGTAITLTASGKDGNGTYTYKFSTIKNGTETVIQPAGSSASCTWTPDAAGTYKLKVTVSDGTNTAVKEISYVINASAPLTISSFTSDLSSPQLVWNKIKLSVQASGGTGTLQYKFYRVDRGAITVFRDYAASNEAYCNPGAGTYTIYVDVKDAAGNIKTSSMTFTWQDTIRELTINSFTSDLASPQPAWTKVRLTANASGGTGTLQYKFYRTSGGTVTVFRDYATSNVTYCNPGTGAYQLYVDVKDGAGTTRTKSMAFTWGVSAKKLTIDSFTSDLVSPQPAWTKIRLTAGASGGTGTLQYRFYRTSGGTANVFRDYATSNETYCNPGTGTYTLYVDVRDGAGTIVTKSMNFIWGASAKKLTIDRFTADLVSPQPAWTKIKLTTRASGGTGTLQYRFYRINGSSIDVFHDYAAGNETYCNPGSGTYTLYTDVKDSANTVVTKSMVFIWR